MQDLKGALDNATYGSVGLSSAGGRPAGEAEGRQVLPAAPFSLCENGATTLSYFLKELRKLRGCRILVIFSAIINITA